MITEQQVIDVLKAIYDPELYIDIYTLGLIYGVEIKESTVNIRMTFTSVACPAGAQLVEQVQERIKDIDGVEAVHVEVVFQPPWEPSEDLKAMMGIS